jgi:histidinol-phosphate aminotransferase
MHSKVIKSVVRSLRAYSLSPHRASVKINQNENPWDAPKRVKEETLRRFSSRRWSRYPAFLPTDLHEKLAQFAGWQADGVIAGNGSNELIQALLMVTVENGTRVLISEPTFALYRQVATVLGGVVENVPHSQDLVYDPDALIRRAEDSNADIVILCSPNNPTGCVIDDDKLRRLIKSTTGLVVIDEAYHEFSDHSVVPLLNEFDNLVVLRTFSKAMALAALRVGYLLAAPTVASEIRKAVLPYNLNAFSQTAAEVAVEMYEEELRPLVQRIVAERERLFTELKTIDGLSPISSHANFMIVRSAIDPKRVFEELVERDVLVRDVSSYPMLGDFFRISVGTPEENDVLLNSLQSVFEKQR